VLGNARRRGVRAMRRAKRIVHEDITELGQRARQSLIVFLFAP
jgi:hypothetical protein